MWRTHLLIFNNFNLLSSTSFTSLSPPLTPNQPVKHPQSARRNNQPLSTSTIRTSHSPELHSEQLAKTKTAHTSSQSPQPTAAISQTVHPFQNPSCRPHQPPIYGYQLNWTTTSTTPLQSKLSSHISTDTDTHHNPRTTNHHHRKAAIRGRKGNARHRDLPPAKEKNKKEKTEKKKGSERWG